MRIESILSELQSLLYGWNYAVFLHRYCLPFIPGIATQDYIIKALPNSQIRSTQHISGQEVLAEVEQSLRYTGDAGCGPKFAALNSPKFEELLTAFLLHLNQSISSSTDIICFSLKSGNPNYPVFWGFSFVIVGENDVEVFIGSSSD
jgi:hypothetical protein